MAKIFFILIYLILTALIVAYIDSGIRSHDMDFYHGKDNGYIERFESILYLNVFFFILMTIGKKQTLIDYVKVGLLGLVTAFIIGIVCYLIFISADYYGLTYHIATIVICYSSYFGLKKSKLLLARVFS